MNRLDVTRVLLNSQKQEMVLAWSEHAPAFIMEDYARD